MAVVVQGERSSRRVAIVGDEPLAAQCADLATAVGLEVVLVVTANPLVAEQARRNGIAVVGPGEERAGLAEPPADVLLSIANLRMLPAEVLDAVAVGINFHDGPLPGYAGLNVTSWALLAGETEHEVTWHVMTTAADAGEIVTTESFPIAPDETAFSLNARCYEAALASFPRVAAAIAGGELATSAQPPGERRLYRRHDRPGVLIDPTVPAATIARQVRALDLGHRLLNALGVPRLVVGDDVVVVEQATAAPATGGAAPGTIVERAEDGLRLATADGDVWLRGLRRPTGEPADVDALLARHGLAPGAVVPALPPTLAAGWPATESSLAPHEQFWLGRAIGTGPTVPAVADPGATPVTATFERPGGADDAAVVAAVAIWLARTSATEEAVFAVLDADQRATLRATAPLTRAGLTRVDVIEDRSFDDVRAAVAERLAAAAGRGVLLTDALGRDPRTREHEATAPGLVVELGDGAGADAPPEGALVRIALADGGIAVTLAGSEAGAGRVAEQLRTLLAAGLADGGIAALDLPLVGDTERADLAAVNRTEVDHDRSATVDAQFRDQVARTPDAPALSADGTTMTYAELAAAVDALAGRLAAAGVGRGGRVGIATPRGASMVVAVLATLQRGAAYVPLDPTYPVERVRFMVEDADLVAVVARGRPAVIEGIDVALVDVSATAGPAGSDDVVGEAHTAEDHAAEDLAYLIYTSGSTGTPKGVMLEHREVANFFVAMDDVLAIGEGTVWLAVTSLSFDISVLELLWTLTRGCHVVVKADSGFAAGGEGHADDHGPGPLARPLSFSLFYFAAGADNAGETYRLLLESARFADANGFEAVWTPERHFHDFGSSYPNPSVASAALAAITEHVAIRAGSVVLPLHSPIRVAEEWSVVDNLSRGRVGISFAAGWQPNDFVLNPGAYATARESLGSSIDVVKRLWRGETVMLPGHDGADVAVRTHPRPIQPELPVWMTSAGTPATFERAGTLGVNVLTHLLGQSVEQLTGNIERYRQAWRAAGHEGEGRVTLMLHTFLGHDGDHAREVAREPLKRYLGTAVGLLRDVASAFPTFANSGRDVDDLFRTMTPDELEGLLEVAADRYLGSSGLFGTPEEGVRMVQAVAGAGVDEVACLVDFGIATDTVLDSLALLLDVKREVEALPVAGEELDASSVAGPVAGADPDADRVHALVERYGVTHLQCTPSLAAMLVADPDDRVAVGRLGHLMVGGEALPVALASELRGLLPGRFTNMYGPTETTIWSLVHELDEIGPTVPIGRPIANTTIHVLDPRGHPLPLGALGELHIGGEGVARGYHARPELTASRFVERPGMGRVYATGDIVRIREDGLVEFAGRADNQVKIRGHRIELGEIESRLDGHPEVVQSVVVAREERGDVRLVAFVVLGPISRVTGDDLRTFLADQVPEAWVPSAIVPLDAFPLTPNGKIDRRALPQQVSFAPTAGAAVVPPASDHERVVADVWAHELERPVGRDDNFFDIGGHSLLAVKVFRRLAEETGRPLALTDVFRFPTVRRFAAHLASFDAAADGGSEGPAVATVAGTDRGALRRRARERRGG